MDMWLFPVFLKDRKHWVAGVVDFTTKQIEVYDSLRCFTGPHQQIFDVRVSPAALVFFFAFANGRFLIAVGSLCSNATYFYAECPA